MLQNYCDLPERERRAMIGLTHVAGVGPGLAVRLLQHFGNAESIFAALTSELQGIQGLGPTLVERLQKGMDEAFVSRVLRDMEEHQIQIWLYGSPLYPSSLYQLSSPPLLLYVRGAWRREWRSEVAVAFVGTRRPDSHGVQLTRQTVTPLVQEDWWIVSGGALGIDTAAHRAALSASGVTIAVLASGVDRPYPPHNRELFRAIVERGGLLLSEFPPGTRPEKGYFPRRNRLISALSRGVVVVQCGAKSGALHTATCARRIQVPVLTFPGRPSDPLAAGPHSLIRAGAHLITSSSDIIHVLTNEEPGPEQLSLWEGETKHSSRVVTRTKESSASHADSDLPELWDNILKTLPTQSHCTKALDDIAHLAEASVEEVLSALVLMELDGIVWTGGDMSYGRVESLQS